MRPKPPEDKLRDMGFCEQTLDLEHREWGRLMIESEIMPRSLTVPAHSWSD